MRFSTIFFAALPALAMADGSATATTEPAKTTTTLTSTTHLVKTMTLSKVHTVTSSACNTTSSWSAPTSAQVTPTTVPTDKPNGATALDAGNMIVAGIAGIVAVAML